LLDVRSAIRSLAEEGVLGAALCSLVILLFLGEWRLTLESGTDKINLGHFLGSLQIQFIGGSAFSGSAGQARFANGRFELDVDGDRRPELTVMVQGNVAAGDFYFWDDVGYGTGGWDGSGAGWWDY